jgi:hypothetical protein
VIVAQTSSGTERRVLSRKLNGARQRGRASSRPAGGEQRADHRNGQRFPDALADLGQPIGRQIGREEAGDEFADGTGRLAGKQRAEADVEQPETGNAAATMAAPTSPLRQPNGDGRAAGGVSRARRSQPDRPSARRPAA